MKLPSSLRGYPFPGRSLGGAVNVLRRCDLHPGQTVAVVGAGFLGLLLIQLMAAAGLRIFAIARREFSLRLARRYGACEAISLDDDARVIALVRRLTDGRGCERVIETAGAARCLDLTAQIAARRGRLVIAGTHGGPQPVNLRQWRRNGLDIINAHEPDPEMLVRGMRDAADAIVARILDPAPLFTHRFGLANLDEAFAVLETRPERLVKALVEMR